MVRTALLASGIVAAQVPSPTVEEPITSPGVPFVSTTSFDLAQVGYERAEYFVSGTVSAYAAMAPPGPDGE